MMTTNLRDTAVAPADPARTPYEQLGGQAGVRALVDRFYDLMDMDEDLAPLRALHGPSLDAARDKLWMFLCGYLGGPSLYVERYGHPRLRARHLPFAIDTRARDLWLACMERALRDQGVAAPLAERLMHDFYAVADWMRNREG
jgi:Truncated hemoglobins